MLSEAQQTFLQNAFVAATQAGHPWPKMAACEAALETGWGTSQDCREHNNLLGIKVPSWWQGGVAVEPTHEFIDGAMQAQDDAFSTFASWAECYRCAVEIMQRDSAYASALSATDPETFITLESKVWATDPNRAANIIEIYNNHAASLVTPTGATT